MYSVRMRGGKRLLVRLSYRREVRKIEEKSKSRDSTAAWIGKSLRGEMNVMREYKN